MMVRNVQELVEQAICPPIGSQLAAGRTESRLARVRYNFRLSTLASIYMASKGRRSTRQDLDDGGENYWPDPLAMLGDEVGPVRCQDDRKSIADLSTDSQYDLHYTRKRNVRQPCRPDLAHRHLVPYHTVFFLGRDVRGFAALLESQVDSASLNQSGFVPN